MAKLTDSPTTAPLVTPSPRAAMTQPGEEGGEAGFQQYFDIVLRRRWLLLTVLLAVVALTTLYTITRRRIYEGSTMLVVVNGTNRTATNDAILGSLAALTQSRSVDTQVEIMKSQDLLDAAFQKLTPAEQMQGFHSTGIPKWAYRIENTANTDSIQITASAYVPALAAKLANDIAQTYLRRDLERNNQATAQARKYVEEEMARSKDKLAQASAKLAAFKRRTGLVAPDAQLESATDRYFTIRENYDTAQSALDASKRRLTAMDQQVKSTPSGVQGSATVAENPVFAQVAQGISDLQASRSKLLQEYTPNSPEVQQVNGELAREQRRLQEVSKTVVASTVKERNPVWEKLAGDYADEVANQAAANVQLQNASDALTQSKKELSRYPEQERILAQLAQSVDVLDKTYDMLSQRYFELHINEESNLANGFIASYARTADEPSYPKVQQSIVLSVVFGLVVAVACALVVERLDTRVHDPATVERVTGLSVLTAVPETDHGAGDRPLIGSVEHGHAFLESFRILRNNIAFSMLDRPLRILAVTSAGRAEGKTTSTINLAISMAMDGKRVLLIDGDLRRPSLHTTLEASREVGFTTVVTGRQTLQNAVQTTAYEGVYLLPSGPLPPNPTEFLNSSQTRAVLEQAMEEYDLVILDSPPCSGLSDVQVISTLADALVLVVSLDVTQKPQLQATMQTLWQAEAPVLGVILNRIEARRPGYGYYYSYYYYYYSYEEGDAGGKGRRKSGQRKDKKPKSGAGTGV